MSELFEKYLRDVHANGYNGTDDDMQANYELWLHDLDNNELIEYGNNAIEDVVKNITT